jgi:protein-S-isoprenylcysteine O-methyltransferase Ste14
LAQEAALQRVPSHAQAEAAWKAPRRAAGWRWVFSTSTLATLWLAFFEANLKISLRVGHPVGAGMMLLELVVATLYVCRRQSLLTSASWFAWFAAGIGTFGALAARPSQHPLGGLEQLYFVLQLAGALAAVTSLLTLGRSFGVVAANRGVRTGGPYRLVRHPAYGGGLLALTGYLLENPSPGNAVIVLTVTFFQLRRIHHEEKFLNGDASYREYRQRVRYRLLPYIY